MTEEKKKFSLSRFNPFTRWMEKQTAGLEEKFENRLIEELSYVTDGSKDVTINRKASEDYAFVYESDTSSQQLLRDGLWMDAALFEKLKKQDASLKKRVLLREGSWVLLGTSGLEDSDRVQEVEELHDMQDAAFNKFHSDPHVKNITKNVGYFTIGRGMRFQAANDKVQEELLKFWSKNKMNARQKAMVESAWIEGEYFILYYVNQGNGTVRLRKIRPKEISDIETHPEDVYSLFSYQREYYREGKSIEQKYYQDIDYPLHIEDDQLDREHSIHDEDFDKTKFVQFIKYGHEEEKRGRVPMDTVLQWCKLYKDWLYDRARLNHERSKVVWIKSVLGGADVRNLQVMRAPKGGMMLVETKNVKYRTESAKLEAGDASEDGKSLLYMIGAGVNMPIYILDQRADEQVYASIKRADTPFSQFILDNQDKWSDETDRMFRFVLRMGVEYGKLPKTVKVQKFTSRKRLEEIQRTINEMVVDGKSDSEITRVVRPMVEGKHTEISVPTEEVNVGKIWPDVVKEDAYDEARVFEIHRRIGIASIQTLSERAGYDFREELFRMSQDKRNDEPVAPKSQPIGKGQPAPDAKPAPKPAQK